MPRRLIETEADIAAGLRSLMRRDPRLRAVARVAGEVPVRRRPGGMEGLARIVVGQQLSVASAEAIWSRFATAFPGSLPEAILAADEAALRAPGLSAAKIRTLRALSEAVAGGLALDELAALPAEEAHARLTAVKGIGPWTADVYLLFCLGHPDIFPAGDLALRYAVAEAFGLAPPVTEKAVAAIAAAWSPWRGVAAALFWAYYRARRQRNALPI
ncbi:MAG: DNA-3-methyladenine glycosylase 2 family protein [Rhizobiales bacterium]|nr:DNA-3-methyladenine glycosylase 2 family protein [Hyphomicrobiales bacterium]